MKMKKILGVAAMAVALLAGCGTESASEYVGKWVNVKSDKRTLEIERNGDGYMARYTEPSRFSRQSETKNIPAAIKDGTLQMSYDSLGMTTFTIDKASGNLTDGKTEYKRY